MLNQLAQKIEYRAYTGQFYNKSFPRSHATTSRRAAAVSTGVEAWLEPLQVQMLVVVAGFQAGPTFPTFPYFFLCSFFSLLFFLKLPYYPYFLVKTVWSDRKLYIFSLLTSLARCLCKNQINLIWAAMMQKFIKYFFFSYNSFFWKLILVFPSRCNIVLLFRENFVCFSFSKSENTQNIPTIPTFHD